MAGTCILPVDILRDDPYFSKEKHAFSRAEALAWIAANVRYVDNCTLKKWQESWSLRYLANAWGWTVKRVRCFLKACENRGFIRTSLGHIKGTAQIVITYMVQRLNWSSDEDGAQVGAQQGHSRGTNKGGKETQEKKDSCQSQAPDDPMAGLEPQPQRAAGAGPSKPASGAGCTNPNPQPAESQQAAPDGADLPKNSAQKGSAKRRSKNIKLVATPEFWAFWRKVEKFPGLDTKMQGPTVTYAAWEAIEDVDRHVGAIMAAVPRWRSQVESQIERKRTPCTAATWLNDRRWEVEFSEEEIRQTNSEWQKSKTWKQQYEEKVL